MLPNLSYAEAPLRTSLQSLLERRIEACRKFLLRSQQQEPMKSFLHSDSIRRDHSLPSVRNRSLTPKLNTERFREFVTIKAVIVLCSMIQNV